MGWRTVIVDSAGKIGCKNGYLYVVGDAAALVHLSEIDVLMISTTQAVITTYAISELTKNKIKVVFCDEKRDPCGELSAYYGSHNTSKKVSLQCRWSDECKQEIFTKIVAAKISNQAKLLEKTGHYAESEKLTGYTKEIELNDASNREGFAAKVYFNTLFGKDFVRGVKNDVNAALNYGYTIMLSAINREVVSNGCITQLGLKHCNEFNKFNLSSDIIEPFRVVVDEFVYRNAERELDRQYKIELVDLLNKQVMLAKECVTVSNAIKICVKSIIDCLNTDGKTAVKLYEL